MGLAKSYEGARAMVPGKVIELLWYDAAIVQLVKLSYKVGLDIPANKSKNRMESAPS